MIQDNGLCIEAVGKWGNKAQMDMAIEEMAELIHAISKFKRKQTENRRMAVVEEMADVLILMAQLEHIFTYKEELESAIKRKLQKLELEMNDGLEK